MTLSLSCVSPRARAARPAADMGESIKVESGASGRSLARQHIASRVVLVADTLGSLAHFLLTRSLDGVLCKS